MFAPHCYRRSFLYIARYVPLLLTAASQPPLPPLLLTAAPSPPLLQHAYYLDHQNRRADYISIFLDHLVAWDVVEERYAASLGIEGSD